MRYLIASIYLTFSFVLAGVSSAEDGEIMVSIPDTCGISGDTVLVPVQVSSLNDLEVSSVLAVVTFSDTVLQALGISITPNTLVASSDSLAVNATIPGKLEVGIARPGDFAGQGVLFYITFAVVGQPPDTSTIHFDDFMFNEGIPSTTTEHGFIRITPRCPGVVVWVRANPKTVYYGDSSRVEIRADNVTDLGAYQFSLGFNPDLVHAIRARNGPFLESTGRTPIEVANSIDNINGKVSLAYCTIGKSFGPNGGGILGIIDFRAKQKVENTEKSLELWIGSEER